MSGRRGVSFRFGGNGTGWLYTSFLAGAEASNSYWGATGGGSPSYSYATMTVATGSWGVWRWSGGPSTGR